MLNFFNDLENIIKTSELGTTFLRIKNILAQMNSWNHYLKKPFLWILGINFSYQKNNFVILGKNFYMPGTSLKLNSEIFRSLAQNYNKSFTLEELTELVSPCFNLSNRNNQNRALERESQAKVLEALLFLADHGLILLNPLTDQSSIK